MWRMNIAKGGNDPYLFSTNNYVGRQIWEFDPNYGTPEELAEVEQARAAFWNNRHKVKTSSDVIWRMQFLREKGFKQTIPQVKIDDGEEITDEKAKITLRRAVNLFSALQADDGHWPAENGGPQYFMQPLVMCLYVTGHLNSVFTEEYRKEILRYMYCHQNEDGGWGFHIEGHSIMFCTTLSYICMRLLGEGPDGGLNGACAKARKWILDHGTATANPSWGKTWLSILGLCEWSGTNPMPPEFWILPSFLPMHPAKMWCYCRLVYMPMSYLYGKRFVGPITPLILELRNEIFLQPYHEINWKSIRHVVAKEDIYYPHPLLQDLMWDSLYIFTEPLLNRWPFNKLREKALRTTMNHIHYEDENSRYITIGSVEKALCMLSCWVEDPNGICFKKHLARVPDYLWVGEDGMKMQSFGSQEWDAGFAIQALLATDLTEEIGSTLKKGHEFIKASQENNKDPYRFSLEDIILISTNSSQVRGNGHYTIAAKRLDTSHGQRETEFYNELQIFKKNVDKNFIGLVGYCNETDEKILVYEYAFRGSLDKCLNDVSLTWKNRLNICISIAGGLLYLHQCSQETIIHRDIKSANILLSDDWKAKIGDFGLSRESTINQDKDYVIDHVCGTRGYLDPLYLKSGFLTRESDIYSFGVVLFDILFRRSTYAICHQKGQYLPSFIKRKVYYLNFNKRNWTEMTLLSFIGLILLAAPTCSATAGSWSGDPDDEGLISLADHKNIFQVVPGDVKNVWNEWVLRGLILISLISQIALCLLGYIRKYNWRTPVRMGLWCTCLLAYSVVPAALGMITQSNSVVPTPPVAQPHRLNTSELMSFWAPFLFLHLGGPDSITAFALEDSELYLRYFVEMVFLSVVALYILLQSWPGYSYLPQLSILVYLAGFVKCSERIQALRLANTGYLRNSMLSPPDPGPNYQKFLDDEVPETLFQTGNKGSGTVISDAYDLFQTFKRLFEDLILTFEDREGSRSYFRHLRSDDAFHIVEIELGFAFDMLYTKANAVYTLMGLILRLTSFFFLLMVLVCFYIFYDMDSYPSIDIVITHLLVGLAIFMEIFSVITMLCSDWTDHWLSQRDLTRNILVFPFLKHPTKRRWSGSIGQFDLLSVAIEEKPATCLKIQKFFGLDFICVKHRYKALSKVSDNLKHLIYNHFRELMVFNFSPKELCSHKGSFSLQKNECDSLLWSTTKVEFDKSILIWHIATSLCYYSELDNQEDGDIYTCRKESKRISDYLLYLLVTYPWMLPAGIGMVRYRDTCAEAVHFFKEKGPKTAKVEACTKLIEANCMEVLPCKVKDGRSKSALSDGCRLALALKEMGRERMWKVISQVWIEILGYAATHCRGIHHKQHLGKGGEFLTHVWLLMAHLGITDQFQEFHGHSRAKINV